MQRGITDFGNVVRRDRRRHADGNAGGAIGEQIRKGARENRWLFLGAIIVGAEIYRGFVQILQQQLSHESHARFGVTIGGGAIAIDIAEIALAIDQGITRGKILRHAHHGLIDRLVAMG